MVDLDSNPTKLIELVAIDKQDPSNVSRDAAELGRDLIPRLSNLLLR